MPKLPQHIEERYNAIFAPDLFDAQEQEKAMSAFISPDSLDAKHKSFIATILNEERERIIKTIQDLRKTKGTEDFANFKLPNDDIWLSAKPVQPNIKRLVYNSALDSVINLIKEDK